MVMDQATEFVWSYFISVKHKLCPIIFPMIDKLMKMGYQIKFVCMDGVGENKTPGKKLQDVYLVINIKYTPRNMPQYNAIE